MASHTKDPARGKSRGASEVDQAAALICSEYTTAPLERQLAYLIHRARLTEPAAHTVAELVWGQA